MSHDRALIVVDLQNDFMPGGALAAPDGDAVVPVANFVMSHYNLVVASQDWHPAKHGSFASQHPGKKPGDIVDLNGLDQILWPDHCVESTEGAAFHADLTTNRITKVFHKGTDPAIDSYSTFFDNAHGKSTGMADYLREQGVTDVYLLGLTTDYCVKFSALDAIECGFKVHVVEDACRGIDLHPGDVSNALDQMRAAGVEIVRSDEIQPTA